MEWNQRMQALLDQCDPEQEDDLTSELIDLESQLTIHELLLLLKAAVLDGIWLWEPLVFQCHEEGSQNPRPLSAAVELSAFTLRQLTGQARMVELGFLAMEEKPKGWEYVLTPKGAQAVAWWAEELAEELGFGLPAELTADA